MNKIEQNMVEDMFINDCTTNGDMIKAMFPHAKIRTDRYTYCVEVKLEYHSQYDTGLLFDKTWWNKKWKRGKSNGGE